MNKQGNLDSIETQKDYIHISRVSRDGTKMVPQFSCGSVYQEMYKATRRSSVGTLAAKSLPRKMLVLWWRRMGTKWWKIEKIESFCTFFAQHLLACLPSLYEISVSNNRVWGVRESTTEDNSTRNCPSKLDMYKAMGTVEMYTKNTAGADVILRLLSAAFERPQSSLQRPSDWKKTMFYSIRKSKEGNLGD